VVLILVDYSDNHCPPSLPHLWRSLLRSLRLLQADPEEAYGQRRAGQGRCQRRPEILLV